MPTLAGPRGPIPYERDPLGYPQVVARDHADAAWAQGWFHATDRLATAQLTMQIARGRAMELLGDGAVPRLLDRFVHLLDFSGDLPEQTAALDAPTRSLMEAYCAGFNAGAAKRGRPLVLRALGLKVEAWTLETVLLTYRLLAFFGLTSMQLSAELTVLELVADRAPDRLMRLLLGDAYDALDRDQLGEIELPNWLRLLRLGFMGGSNAVAVSAARSASGSALLEGDPHLEIGRFPPLGYAFHYEVVGDADMPATFTSDLANRDYNQGVGVAGWPLLTSGRTPSQAWSYTYAHADHVDVIIEDCRPGQYRRGEDTWLPLTRREVEVRVRGRKTPETWVFWDSPYGTVVGGLEATTHASDPPTRRLPCIRWMGLRRSAGDLNAFRAAVRATSFDESLSAHRAVSTIAVALVGAHESGRIGSIQTGVIDQRPTGWNGAGPWPGWTLPVDGAPPAPLSEDSRPVCVDPEEGLFVSANVREDGPDGHMWCTLPEPTYRYDRIHELLGAKEKISLDDLASAVYDEHDLSAARFMPLWVPLLPPSPELTRLEAWATTQPQPPSADDRQQLGLFHALHTELVRVLLARELDPSRADRFIDELALPLYFQNKLDAAFALEHPELLDAEGLRALLVEAWPRALARMDDPSWWAPVEEPFKNIFTLGKEPALLGLSTRPFPWPGGPVSPLQARIMTLGGERMPGGPGWRVLFDLGKPGGWYNLAGGASERRFGPGYGKGLDEWVGGRFLPFGGTEGPAPGGR